MKTYRVTIDGETYAVTVEEMTGTDAPPAAVPTRAVAPAAAAAPTAAQPPRPATKRAPAPSPPLAAGAHAVLAPMPGKILAVNVAQGDAAAAGAVLLVLEAMKMENDILAPADGKVTVVKVQTGDTVNTGDLMVVLE